jgi:cytochrome c553
MRTALMLLSLLAPAAQAADVPPPAELPAQRVEAGRRIYLEGVLPSGAPLRARREGGAIVSGTDAACVQCHRRTGLGSYEGSQIVPPVIGQALFARFRKPGDRAPRRTAGMKFIDFDYRARPPYDEGTLARALREGVSSSGYVFKYLMPRYELDDEAMAALVAYLRTLAVKPSPGVAPPGLHFATVVAPGVDPTRRKLFLDTLNACFDERNPRIRAAGHDHAASGGRWQLHLWQLEGDPATWNAQLEARYAAQPVFALLSGLGGDHWEPVHGFCADRRLPCLFPNVDVPGGGEDAYNFYLSRGVFLDGGVLARHLADEAAGSGLRRVVQVAGPGRAEALSAQTLRQALEGSPLAVEERPLPAAGESQPPAHGYEDLGAGDVLVLWLRPPELAAFAARLGTPPAGARVFVSRRLLDTDSPPLAPAWREALRMVYPYDAPGRWALRAEFNLKPWLGKHKLPAGDERLQGSVVTACAVLSEALGRTQGLPMRDYLVETIEYLGEASNAPATAPYPRFTLGPTQRAGSKGAYIVRLGGPGSAELLPESDWIVP